MDKILMTDKYKTFSDAESACSDHYDMDGQSIWDFIKFLKDAHTKWPKETEEFIIGIISVPDKRGIQLVWKD